jgi:hypothetical protein
MWSGTLQGSDIQQANAKLKDQHSAIRAHLKHLETRIADLEALERSIVNFVSNYEVEDGSSAPVVDSAPVTEKDVGDQGRSTSSGTATVVDLAPATEMVTGEVASKQGRSTSSGTATVVDLAPVTEKDAGEKRKSTWLNPEKLSAVWTPAERAMHAIVQTR